MSRSFKKFIGHYHLCCVHSRLGKQRTSRSIRHAVKQNLKHQDSEGYFEYVHLQDCKRGNKGSRCLDWGWDYFGDGYSVFHCSSYFSDLSDSWKEKYFFMGVK